jgi:nitroreductase
MFLELAKRRRSIRKYQQRPVEPEKIEALVEAALRAPSSRGINPWEFVVIQDRQMLEQLSRSKDGSRFLESAPLAIVVCADPDRSDVWIEDSAIASTILLFEAQSLGLGACWIQIRGRQHSPTESSEDYIKRLLEIPKNLSPDGIKKPHAAETLGYQKVSRERYGKQWRSE